MKKIFQVQVEMEMYVYAENEEEAESLAEDNYKHEWVPSIHATELRPNAKERLPPEVLESIPWGDADDKTVAELLTPPG